MAEGEQQAQSSYPDPSQLEQSPYPSLWQQQNAYGPFTAPQGQSSTSEDQAHLTVPFSGLSTDTISDHNAGTNPLSSNAASKRWQMGIPEVNQDGYETAYQTDHDPLRNAGDDEDDNDEDDDDDEDDTESDEDDDIQAARPITRAATQPNDDSSDDSASIINDPTMTTLTSNPRGRGRGRGHSRGTNIRRKGGWRQLLKGTEWENVGRAPRPTRETKSQREPGVRRPKSRKKKPVDPGPVFRQYLAQANQAFVEGDFESAADHARQAVMENPEVFQAHSLLAEILKAQGHGEDAAETLRIGAITLRLPHVWVKAAEELIALGEETGDVGMYRRAISCYGDALKLNLSDQPELHYEIRCTKFELYKQIGDWNKARLDCKNIMRIWPEDLEHMKEFAELCNRWSDKGDLRRAKEIYDKAFVLRAERPFFAESLDESWSHLNIYLELCDLLEIPKDGLFTARRLARWFLGRKEETFWDAYRDDDREFDMDDMRREMVDEYRRSPYANDALRYGEGLPVEIRIKLGLCRIKMGPEYFQEALAHFRPLRIYDDYVSDYQDVFLQVANSLRESGYLEEAMEFYEPLRKIPDELDETAWMAIAMTLHLSSRFDEATTAYEEVVAFKGGCYPRAASYLVRRYGELGDMVKARFLCNELIKIGRRDLLSKEQLKMVTPSIPSHPISAHDIAPKPADLPSPEVMAMLSAPRQTILPTPQQIALEIPRRQYHELQARENAESPQQDTSTQNSGLNVEDDSNMTPVTETPRPRKRRAKKSRAEIGIADEEQADASSEGDEDREVSKPRRAKGKRKAELLKQAKLEERLQSLQVVEMRVREQYEILLENWSDMLSGQDDSAEQKWFEAAVKLQEEFMSTKIFFSAPSYKSRVKLVNENGIKTYIRIAPDDPSAEPLPDFHNITISEWHRIFSTLALLHLRYGQQDQSRTIINQILFNSNAFTHIPLLDWATYGVAIRCALGFNDAQTLCDLARRLIHAGHSRAPLTYQLFAALNRLTHSNPWFNAGSTQKFMLRMVKTLDYMSMPPARRDALDWTLSRARLEARAQQFNDGKNALDPGLLLTYGHMVAVANHSHSALLYYYRALALRPRAACVLLSLATVCVQLAMKRQTDDRHGGIAQGLAFLGRYREVRLEEVKVEEERRRKGGDGIGGQAGWSVWGKRQEVEYNVARMWHYLGLMHLAVPGYKRVLEMSGEVRKEAEEGSNGEEGDDDSGMLEDGTISEDFAYEAAYALQGIYSLVGNHYAARRITEEWLVM